MKTSVIALSLGCVALGCGGCTQPAATVFSATEEYMNSGNYYLAYHALDDAPEAIAADPARYRVVHLAYLLQQGQEQVFNNDELVAVETFERALELDPGNKVATAWIDKAKRKLAARAVSMGDEQQASGDLKEALLSYHEALTYVPNFPSALDGIEGVAKTVDKRKARAEDHYIQGVAALGEQLFETTWYHMVNAVSLDPEIGKARRVRDQAGSRLVQERYAKAKELEQNGYWGAALKEYEAIHALAPDLEGIEDRIAHARKEVEAERLVHEAEMEGFKKNYDRARELLESALATSTSQQDAITDLLILVKERDLDDRYQRARILEYEHRLADALAAYQEIDALWPGFKDVRASISGIQSTLEIAEAARVRGEQAEQSGDIEAAIEAYEEALLACPEYADLDEKVAALRAKREQGK
jgi:tetratricopeptide (TPR) repeat protein